MKNYLGMAIIVAMAITSQTQGEVLSSLTDFEPDGFVVGQSVHNLLVDGTPGSPAVNYGNWEVPAWALIGAARSGNPADEQIVDLGGEHGKVWRYSTGEEDGSLGATPKSPHAGFVAGETGAHNDAGMGAVTSNSFFGQVEFRSVTMASQEGLGIRICAASMDRRHGYVLISDDGTGFDLKIWRADTEVYDVLDTNLSYTNWHTLGIELLFADGPANDTFNLYVNGSKIYTGPSWEAYYPDEPSSVDRLSFDVYEDASFLGGGLYIDNVMVSNIPEPASLSLIALGGLLALRRQK